jgi:hypothetical protein
MSDEIPKPKEAKPIGSGIFSASFGVGFFVLLITSCWFDLRRVDPYKIFQLWLFFAATILTVWGFVRIAKVLGTGSAATGHSRLEIGQPTLNFVVGVIAATVAIFALVVQRGG